MFVPSSPDQVVRLINEHPLAWIVSHSDARFGASVLPLLPECDAEGRLVSLLGHFARHNPQVAALERSPRAIILFTGPQGYVSPALVSAPGWAPTWNYAVAAFPVEIEFVPDENDHALRRLVAVMEADQDQPWQVEAVGARYEPMRARIIAFRAHIKAVLPKFKLGQDEPPALLAELLTALGGTDLGAWMAAANADRIAGNP